MKKALVVLFIVVGVVVGVMDSFAEEVSVTSPHPDKAMRVPVTQQHPNATFRAISPGADLINKNEPVPWATFSIVKVYGRLAIVAEASQFGDEGIAKEIFAEYLKVLRKNIQLIQTGPRKFYYAVFLN